MPATIIVTTPEELCEIVQAAVAQAMAAHRSEAVERSEPSPGNPSSRLVLLTIEKVAERVSLSRRTIERRLEARTFPKWHRLEGRYRMWLSTAIDHFIQHGHLSNSLLDDPSPVDRRLLKMPAVSKRVSLCSRSIHARIKCGTFPPPDRMEGPHRVWKSTTIDRFIEHGYVTSKD